MAVEVPMEVFSKHRKTKPIDLRFSKLKYKVSLGIGRGNKEILHDVCGYFMPGQLMAIMGPSGAGKSSLLDVISGYKITGVEGSVTVNGRFRDLDEFRRISCYIQQDDRLQPLLTVMENMRIAADLKLARDVSLQDKRNTIAEILGTLGLTETANTRADRLSGGQKKRLSIALELINNPLIMFLDEPTTGLDSSSCTQCVSLLKLLAQQGRTIVCTIHQPSAMLFQKFDMVYVLSAGRCLYQGATENMVPYLLTEGLPCPKYHNPADYIIELACGEYGDDKVDKLVKATQNGKSVEWFENSEEIKHYTPTGNNKKGITLPIRKCVGSLQATPFWSQVSVLLRRGFIKVSRDKTLTHMRLIVNVLTGIMLGTLWLQTGNKGSRVLDNYNLLFSILIHHVFSTMMLAILTFPMEMSILTKEHFNRWYSLKSFFVSVNVVDFPIPVLGCVLFSTIIYFMSGQPVDATRFTMFTFISLLVVFIAQSVGFMIGAIFNIVNGTFIGPTLVVPMMMFSGFGVRVTDIPSYLQWGTTFSYLKYSLEGYVAAIYHNRTMLPCDEFYCHYRYPKTFLEDVAMPDDQFWNDVFALVLFLTLTKVGAYLLLRWKIQSMR